MAEFSQYKKLNVLIEIQSGSYCLWVYMYACAFFYIPLHWVSVKYDDDDEMTFFDSNNWIR